ncbi:MAG: GDSL-type esterase/lipase family protein [Bacteroides sp.]|nr:GDSL-type esterase/lipase family protein [Bacteroides sp.]
MNLRITIMALVAMVASFSCGAKIKVACVGNSITYGYGLPDDQRNLQSYPSRLARMLGPDYEVGNFGHSGATLLRKGHNPYFALPEFRQALDMKPDIAVIHLGVNDTDPRNWPNYGDEFITDYSALIDSLRAANPAVRILMARLTPIGAKHHRFRTGTRDWRLLEQDAIEAIALNKGVELIDFDAPLRDRQNLMPDAVHPNAEGYNILAETVYSGITGNYGGLKLPPVYQSGMVLQRHRPLTISGTANAGADITLTLDGVPYSTRANNRGQWSVNTAPLADGIYTMTVTDGATTLNLTDIAAGEVWIASGQSNMEFPIAATFTAHETMANANDSLLRFFDMRPIARTDNVAWPDSVLDATDRLEHFRPATWKAASAESIAPVSAIAYHFARLLRDSIQVPVGIISNAVGGAPCEAWIDVNTLEANMPEILVNWRGNDYVQKWAQGRADKNAPAPHRHPYEPSYLFSAGIRPLGSPDIAGVIWYQGESNAHNVELHEQLFPMFVESWRKEFRRPDLPVCFVQLSSIDRPSWPAFRDSQRRMASEMPGVYMAVSSDYGDSLDVHPTHKRWIGHRLARQALHNVYGMTGVIPTGPVLAKATAAANGSVALTFTNSRGLATSTGTAPITFEMANRSGVYHRAEATIVNDSTIILQPNAAVPRPTHVRYGWQPFTRANVVNGEELPLSTFKTSIDNMNQLYELEPGYNRGVSAAFAGKLPSGQLIVAGGCNFPCDDPLGPDAQKKFYQGIYSIDPATLQLTRIGSLAEPVAYGASVTTAQGVVLIGGTTAEGATTEVTLLKSATETEPLPPLPKTIDNLAAAAIGSIIYAAGGNVDGTPSRNLYALDLDNLSKGWKKLGSMPGNPRVQPVMAAANGKLYLWGGFAGRHNGHEPTLELGGLMYDPATGKWTEIPGPETTSGEPVATGGGVAATLSTGNIAVSGGVNKDVFLAALINQAPDYLNHPIPWYAFNPTVYIFNPSTGSWTAGPTSPLQARAGAAAIPVANGQFILFGGELKPRIRTFETIKINGNISQDN